MGWAAKERTGRPAGGAGQHPQDRNAEEVSAACRALRPGAAGLKGSVAHPTDGESYKTTRAGRRSPGPISAASNNRNPPKRIDGLARQRRPPR